MLEVAARRLGVLTVGLLENDHSVLRPQHVEHAAEQSIEQILDGERAREDLVHLVEQL